MTPNWLKRLRGSSFRLFCRQGWSQFAGPNWLDQIMDWPQGERYHEKQGRSIGRHVLPGANGRLAVYLKRQHRLPSAARWLRTLSPAYFPTPAIAEWQNAQIAEELGIPVPRMWAAGEVLGPWGRVHSFLAVEELHGMIALHQAIPLAATRLAPAQFRRWKAGVVMELARLTRLLHDAGYYHQDLYLCHFFIAAGDTAHIPHSWHGRIALIDFHRLVQRNVMGVWYRIKDLAQFLYSSDLPCLNARDRIAFWRAYRRPGDGDLLRRLISWKAGRYRRHNRARQNRALARAA